MAEAKSNAKKQKRKDTKAYYNSEGMPCRFYESAEWRYLRNVVIRAFGKYCMKCSTKARGMNLHCDHIKPRTPYRSLELKITNLQVLCKKCNEAKSNKNERDYRTSKQKALAEELEGLRFYDMKKNKETCRTIPGESMTRNQGQKFTGLVPPHTPEPKPIYTPKKKKTKQQEKITELQKLEKSIKEERKLLEMERQALMAERIRLMALKGESKLYDKKLVEIRKTQVDEDKIKYKKRRVAI